MRAENEFTPEELWGEADALWLDRLPAWEGVRAAFTTAGTASYGALARYGPGEGDPGRGVDDGYIARLCATLEFPYGRLATGRQVHGDRVARIDVAQRRWYPDTDALATAEADTPLAVFTADCVAALVWAPGPRALAVVHAGWRGAVLRLVGKTIKKMETWWGAPAASYSVFLGPAAGVCCYEVGEDVAAAAREAFGERAGLVCISRGGRRFFDLHRAHELAAQEAGVLPANIYRVAVCTICDSRFYSYRREGKGAGRAAAIASVKPGL